MRRLRGQASVLGRDRIVRFLATLANDAGEIDAKRAKRGLILLLDEDDDVSGSGAAGGGGTSLGGEVELLLRLASSGEAAAEAVPLTAPAPQFHAYVDLVTAIDALLLTAPRALSVSLYELHGVPPPPAAVGGDASSAALLVATHATVVRYLTIVLRVSLAMVSATEAADAAMCASAAAAATAMATACFDGCGSATIGFAPFVAWLSAAMGNTAAAAAAEGDADDVGAHLAPHLLQPTFTVEEAAAVMGLDGAGAARLAHARDELERVADETGRLDRARFAAAVAALAMWQRRSAARGAPLASSPTWSPTRLSPARAGAGTTLSSSCSGSGGDDSGFGQQLVEEAVAHRVFSKIAAAAAAQRGESCAALPPSLLPVDELVMSLSVLDTKDHLAACATVYDVLRESKAKQHAKQVAEAKVVDGTDAERRVTTPAASSSSGGGIGNGIGQQELTRYFLCAMRLDSPLPAVHQHTVARSMASAWLTACDNDARVDARGGLRQRQLGRDDFLFCCKQAMSIELDLCCYITMEAEAVPPDASEEGSKCLARRRWKRVNTVEMATSALRSAGAAAVGTDTTTDGSSSAKEVAEEIAAGGGGGGGEAVDAVADSVDLNKSPESCGAVLDVSDFFEDSDDASVWSNDDEVAEGSHHHHHYHVFSALFKGEGEEDIDDAVVGAADCPDNDSERSATHVRRTLQDDAIDLAAAKAKKTTSTASSPKQTSASSSSNAIGDFVATPAFIAGLEREIAATLCGALGADVSRSVGGGAERIEVAAWALPAGGNEKDEKGRVSIAISIRPDEDIAAPDSLTLLSRLESQVCVCVCVRARACVLLAHPYTLFNECSLTLSPILLLRVHSCAPQTVC